MLIVLQLADGFKTEVNAAVAAFTFIKMLCTCHFWGLGFDLVVKSLV